MNKYKVFGDKLVDYYIDVEANSAEEAWDIASAAGTHEWLQIEKDTTIEVHFVEQLEQETDLLEDGWPNMANDIIVADKSDISDQLRECGPKGPVTGVFTNSWIPGKINTYHERIDNDNKA